MVGDDYACGDCHDRHYGHDHHEFPLKDSVDCHLFSDGPGEGRGARALREGGEDMSSSSSSSSSFCSIFYMHVYIACEFSILILGGCLKHKNALTFSVFVQIFSCCLHVLLYTYT